MKVKNLCKAYDGVAVLEQVSFELREGITCLMAPSGQGKTTLLRILLGLETPDSGEIADRPRRWGAVFQEDRLLPTLTAMENLRFALGSDLDEAAALNMLQDVGLGEELTKPAGDYSGGMKRRLALCRGLLRPCDAYALDEPFTGLDSDNKAICLSLIREAAKKAPVLLVTHDEADAAALHAAVLRI